MNGWTPTRWEEKQNKMHKIHGEIKKARQRNGQPFVMSIHSALFIALLCFSFLFKSPHLQVNTALHYHGTALEFVSRLVASGYI